MKSRLREAKLNTVHIRGLRKLFINLFRRDPLTPTTRKTWGPLCLAVPPLPQLIVSHIFCCTPRVRAFSPKGEA